MSTVPNEPTYLYAVTSASNGGKPQVERVQIQYITKLTIRFADRARIGGYRLVLPKDEVRGYGLVETAEEAVAVWRKQTERELQMLEEQKADLRAQLQRDVPNAWETT